mmetsp:Transcript_44442/g.53356  ORF Transcript_44442/g.53356 Transcript_44442/m.53356 type:complete len:201 (+) Transcript_44442:550-1152(+)
MRNPSRSDSNSSVDGKSSPSLVVPSVAKASRTIPSNNFTFSLNNSLYRSGCTCATSGIPVAVHTIPFVGPRGIRFFFPRYPCNAVLSERVENVSCRDLNAFGTRSDDSCKGAVVVRWGNGALCVRKHRAIRIDDTANVVMRMRTKRGPLGRILYSKLSLSSHLHPIHTRYSLKNEDIRTRFLGVALLDEAYDYDDLCVVY